MKSFPKVRPAFRLADARRLAAVLALVLAAPAQANDDPIRDSIDAGTAPDLPFIRCGALFYSNLWWDSAQNNLSDPVRVRYDANMRAALTQANIMRSEKDKRGVDAINAAIKDDLRPFIVSYIKRFEKNASETGAIEDALINDDLFFCQDLVPS